MSRISGYGSSFGQPANTRDRAAAFRARHSIGQRIKGHILKREPNGLYWVQVGGEDLLARLEVQADPGDQLLFIVRALSPEIMLQALSEGGVDTNDLPGLVQRFRAAREVFEVQAASLLTHLVGMPPLSGLRREAFAKALSDDLPAAERHTKALEFLHHINSSMGIKQNAQALYLPWLTPTLRRQEILRRTKADSSLETALSALDADCGTIEARLFSSATSARLSLAAQRPKHTGALQVELMALARETTVVEPTLLGASLLRPNSLGGVLGELFADSHTWSSGILNTRV